MMFDFNPQTSPFGFIKNVYYTRFSKVATFCWGKSFSEKRQTVKKDKKKVKESQNIAKY